MDKAAVKGRGARINVRNKFLEHHHETDPEFLEYCQKEGEVADKNKTKFIEVFPKTIVNKVDSPDVGMGYSMNPYQGCEHGCIYCYARNSHEYWGYDAGLDFERNILIKKNAPILLEKHLQKASWKPHTIVLSGNTDCYQPAEKKYKITRKCLELFHSYKHPVGIITKNSLITRDLDILTELAHENLVVVNISVTSLSESTRRLLEPRTATIKKRLQTIKELTKAGIPVNAMLAPIIPGINSHEILPLAKAVSDAGAIAMGHTVVRLNGAIAQIFEDWLHKAMPDKAAKVLNQIKECHGGNLNDSRFGKRMRGDGVFASQIQAQISLARQKYFADKEKPILNTTSFTRNNKQLSLF